MKRALSGTKSKKAIVVVQPAAKRPASQPKAQAAKSSVAKRATTRNSPGAAPRRRVAKPKVARKTPARRMLVSQRKAPGRKPALVSRKSPVKSPAVVRAKRKVANKVAKRGSIPKKLASVTVTPQPRARTVLARKLSRKTKPAAAPAAPPEEKIPSPVVMKPKRAVGKKVGHKPARAPEFTVPAFLLEGDETPHPASGSGDKFVLGPTPPLDHFDEAKAPLPESYGTGRLFLTARDPHWLYAHWDFTMQEQFRYNAQSMHRHMVLRLHDPEQPGQHISEIHVHPESRHWFAHVEEAGKKYFAEIGFYRSGRKWNSLATSESQRTPPDNISPDATIAFATIPLELPFETMLALLQEAEAVNLPLAHGIEHVCAAAPEYFPPDDAAVNWTSAQDQALASLLAASRTAEDLPSSDEFGADQAWPEFAFDLETGAGLPPQAPTSYVSSFFGGAAPPDFWFHVNAELIVYGATDPSATVTFAGKKISLRPDGSFRFHFALPDGQYELPVTAVSADGTDGRAAELKFTRATEMRGQVAAAPADPALNPPPTT